MHKRVVKNRMTISPTRLKRIYLIDNDPDILELSKLGMIIHPAGIGDKDVRLEDLMAGTTEVDAAIEEYLANMGQKISYDIIDNKYNTYAYKRVVDILTDTSAESLQRAYVLARNISKIGLMNRFGLEETHDEWEDKYKGLNLIGSTLAVIAGKEYLERFGAEFYKYMDRSIPKEGFITKSHNYLISVIPTDSQPFFKYDNTYKHNLSEINSKPTRS